MVALPHLGVIKIKPLDYQMRMIIIYTRIIQLGFSMENNLVHIAISTNILASLIENGCIHAVDFKCLNIDSKKTVWKLFLSAVKLTRKDKSGRQENGYA